MGFSKLGDFESNEKEKNSKSRGDKNLKPTSLFESSNGCIGDLIIQEPIPNLDDLLKDFRLYRNFFENITEFEGWCKRCTIKIDGNLDQIWIRFFPPLFC